MRAVIQRVSQAEVQVNNTTCGSINNGLLVLLGIEETDTLEDIQWLIAKIINLRVSDDHAGLMNLSIKDIDGQLLIVSQFTLLASTKKGNRPSYMRAAKPETALEIYQKFNEALSAQFMGKIANGVFGADMKVSLINDGPVTIMIDSKQKE